MSRIASLLSIAILASLPATASSQQPADTACSYESCAVRYKAKIFGEQLVRGASGERAVRIGFTGSDAADFLSRVESAAAPARKFKAHRTRSQILLVVGAGLFSYFRGEIFGNGVNPTSAEYVGFSVGLGAALLGGFEAGRARNALDDAIWQFNRAPVP